MAQDYQEVVQQIEPLHHFQIQAEKKDYKFH